jgi:hypothetical protein
VTSSAGLYVVCKQCQRLTIALLSSRVFGAVQDFALWATDSTRFASAMSTIYDNSYTFDASVGRVSVEQYVDYVIRVSHRPQTGYYRVVLTRKSNNAVIADSGDQWDSTGVTQVRDMTVLSAL